MKKISFEFIKNNTSIPIPFWYDEKVHDAVMALVNENKILNTIKYLVDLSKEMGTRINDDNGYTGFDFGLKWAKELVVDTIHNYKKEEMQAEQESRYKTIENELKELLLWAKVKDGQCTIKTSAEKHDELCKLVGIPPQS